MKSSISEPAFLDQAILAFNQETGLVLDGGASNECFPDGADASLELRSHGIKYSVELKRWMQQTNVGSLMVQLRKMPAPALLVADYVNPNMADRLRNAGLQFIDAVGNAYLNEQNLYVFIKGNRVPSDHSSPRRTTRAFNASGLKVIFSFLLEPNLVGESYRVIAEASNVSLGTIGWVLNDLKDRGYVRQQGRNGLRSLKSPLDLVDRWVEAYPEKLLPELDMGLFQTQFQVPWKDIDPSKFDGCWSGEVGASILDNYLSPAQGLIYLPKGRLKDLVMKYRLRKSAKNTLTTSDNVRICEKFWHRLPETSDKNIKPHDAAPDILIYADLVTSGDPRNLDAAERLYDQIKHRLQGD